MEDRKQSGSLLRRWKNIKRSGKRNMEKKVLEYCAELSKKVPTKLSLPVVEVSKKIVLNSQVANQCFSVIQVRPLQNVDIVINRPSDFDDGQQASDIEQPSASDFEGEAFIKELWEKAKSDWEIELDEENMTNDTKDEIRGETILSKIKIWASNHSITHMAISDLMKVLNEEIPNIKLPIDGRTVMDTPRQLDIVDDIALGGKYWHYGLERALCNAISNENTCEAVEKIHVIVNIDGLPLYKSSSAEFWPILVRIVEYDHIPPLIVGIYNGRGKYHLNSSLMRIICYFQ